MRTFYRPAVVSLSAALTFVLTFAATALRAEAQRPSGIELNYRPVVELFDAIESSSEYRVYAPADPKLDSVYVSVKPSGAAPDQIIRDALAGTDYQVTTVGRSIFVLKDRRLVVAMPEYVYVEPGEGGTEGSDPASSMFALLDPDAQGASSEVRIYEVGDPEATGTGRVSLSGYVYDSATGEAVPGVILGIEGARDVQVTDRYGHYAFDLAPGRYEINISGSGQVNTKRQVQLWSEGTLDLLSSEKVFTLTEIEILGNRRDNVRQTALGVEQLQMSNIKNIPTAFGESDILKIITSLPGVTSAGEISSGFNVRGGATDQNLILYNDGTIFNPTHLFGLFSAFNPDVVRDMELYKSSIPAKFGGRISSVLDIRRREGNKKEFAGSASIGLLTSKLAIEGPLWKDRTSFILGGRATYSDWLLGLLPEDSGYKNGKAGFWDVDATLSHKFDSNNNLFVDGYYSQDRFSFDANEKYRYRNGNGSVKWRHIFNSRLLGVFSAGYDHYFHNIRNTENEAAAYSLDFGVDQIFGKADFEYRLGDHALNFGLNTIYYSLMPGAYMPVGEGSLVAPDRMEKERALETAIYLSDKWTITDKLEVDAGIRLAMFNAMGPRDYTLYDPDYLPSPATITETGRKSGLMKTYMGPEFRFSARYSILDDLSVKVGVNTMQQFIHKISNNTVMSPTDTWKLSDMNIRPQKGVQYAAGIYKNFEGKFWELSLEGYYKTMKNYLDYRNGAELLMNRNLEQDVVGTRGRAYGVELMARRTQGKLNGWVSYSYSRTELIQDDPRISLPVNDGNWYPADFDKPHQINFVGNFRFTHRLSISLNVDYATGRPITLPIARYGYAGGEYLYYSERNAFRVPDYFRMDFSFNIEPSLNKTRLTHSMITIGVYNLTGRKNAHSIYYKAEGKWIQGYKLSIFGAPIPFVSYNIKF